MTDKSETTEGTKDSFEALLRQAAHPSRTSAQVLLSAGVKLAGGRLEIVRRVGEGGMGIVYEAFDNERKTKVALKTLSHLDAVAIYRLKNEFRALSDVSHANLVRLHELFADDGQWFFTMDLIPGTPFDEWVRPGGTPDESRLRAAFPQLVSAVLAIHGAGKLHRDLKPSNVLVTRNGRVVVLDFGLVASPELGGIGQTIEENSLSGTPAYMAPEQAAGNAATAASDFYAIGVMLFEALTGRLPFEGRAGEMIAAKQTRAAPAVENLCHGAPRDLAALCSELLPTDPSMRLDGATLAKRAVPESNSLAETPANSEPHAPTKLLGRQGEMARLRDAYDAARTGDKPVIVLLSGDSGIGKSALLGSFLAEARGEGHAVVLSGRCYERESVPFKGFDVLIDDLTRYLRRLDAVDAAALVPREVHALRRLFPVLGRIDAIAQAPERNTADAFELRRRAFLALGEMFGRICDRQPLVIAIDDLQWSDVDSTTLLLHLLRQPDAPRVLFIASHRSEGMEENAVLRPLYETLGIDIRLDVRRLDIGPLSTDAATSLLSELGSAPAALVREAGGNPFLLCELARAGNAAHGKSLSDVLRSRFVKLRPNERKLLEVLAVAARPVALEVAAVAAGISDEAHASFDSLRVAHLARSVAPQERAVECYHDRIRESVAAGLDAETARSYHEALAEALEQAPRADPEQLSEHFERAGRRGRAGDYAARAADRATLAFAFEQAARLYKKALSLGTFSTAETHRIQVALADALAHGGLGPLAAEAYLQAATTSDGSAALHLRRKAAEQYLRSGRLEQGRELVAEALRDLGVDLPSSPVKAVATLALERTRLRIRGLKLNARRPNEETREQLTALFGLVSGFANSDALYLAALNGQMLRRALDAGDARTAALGLLFEIWNRSLGLGGVSRVPELAQHARALISELSDPYLEAWQHFMLGCYESYGCPRGDLSVALAHIERFLTFANADPPVLSTYEIAIGQYHRVNLLTMMGRFSELARELPSVVDEAWQRSDLVTIPMFMGVPFHAWLAVDAGAEAEQELSRVARTWSSLDNQYAYQDTALHYGQVSLLHYQGANRRAWECCVEHDNRFNASFASKSTLAAGVVHHFRGMAAATLAAETRDPDERKMLLEEAERAPLLLRATTSGRRFLLLPRAAAACARGDRARAVSLLRGADFDTRFGVFGPVHAHAARRRLGVLLGGDDGKAMVAKADESLRAGGAVEPERLVAMLLPGCEIRQ